MTSTTKRALACIFQLALICALLAPASAAAAAGTVDKQAEGQAPACNDAADNDADQDIDYPNDSDCESLADETEGTEVPAGPPACNDGLDNDSDGDIDYPNDRGCDALADSDEGGNEDGGGSGPVRPRPAPDRATKVGGSMSIRFDPRYGFRGETTSESGVCESKRNVTLRYVDAGPDSELGSAATNRQGKWGVPIFRPGAKHYAVASKKVVRTPGGEQIVCLPIHSRVAGPIRNV